MACNSNDDESLHNEMYLSMLEQQAGVIAEYCLE
jgi:hypothetical protein